MADQPALKSDGKEMNERGEQVRFDEKFFGRGLNPERASDAASLAGKSLLTLERADMLDNAVGEYDIEISIGVVELATVTDRGSDGRQMGCLDKINGMKVECGYRGLVREISPSGGIAADVENGGAIGRLQRLCESTHAPRSKTSAE